MKIFVASFNRASDGCLSKLVQRMKEEDLWTDDASKTDYVLAPGDRRETMYFVIDRYKENKKIIHLWAGEISQGTQDESFRHSISMMSMMQLCTNRQAQRRVKKLLKSVEMKPNTFVIGNLMHDNFEMDESLAPNEPYDVVLYNPPTLLTRPDIQCEVTSIVNLLYGCSSKPLHKHFWIEPNGDPGSDIVLPYVTHGNIPRPQFLGLLKHCRRFITNSSCACYEAPFLMDREKIIMIGVRNGKRETSIGSFSNLIPWATSSLISKYNRMKGQSATEKVIRLLKDL